MHRLVWYALVCSYDVIGASSSNVYTLSKYSQAPSMENVDKDVPATAAIGAPPWSTVGEDPSWAKVFLTARHQGAPTASIEEGRNYATAAPVRSDVPYIVRSEIALATS